MNAGGSRARKEPLKNLFAMDDATINLCNDSRPVEYQRFERELTTELSKCNLHQGTYCKIDKNSYHWTISDQQVRAWVEAYVSVFCYSNCTLTYAGVNSSIRMTIMMLQS